MRYIILDKQLTEITLKSIEENSDISNKLADPFSSFFKEVIIGKTPAWQEKP